MKSLSKIMSLVVLVNLMLGLYAVAVSETLGPPPPTRVEVVTDTIHGVPISDPYRWLEDGANQEVQAWTAAQFDYFRKYVDDYAGRDSLRAVITRLFSAGSIGTPSVYKGKYFFFKRDANQNQSVLYMQNSLTATPEVLIDPNKFSTDGTVAMDWDVLSDDGSMIAFGMSASGTEKTTLYVMRTADKAPLPDTIPYTRSADVSWLRDNSGFYYTRFPAPGSVPAGDENYFRSIYFHKLGTDWKSDPLVFEYAKDKTAWPGVSLSPDGRWMVISNYITYTKMEISLKDLSKEDLSVANLKGETFTTVVNDREALYYVTPLNDRFIVMTNDNAPRYKVMVGRYDQPTPDKWQEIIPERDETIDGVSVIANHIVVSSLKNAYSRVAIYTLEGQLVKELTTPTLGSVSGINGEWDGSEMFYGFWSFNFPYTTFRYDFTTGKQELFSQVKLGIDLTNIDIKQVWYTSKDGTPISMFIVGPKNIKLDGNNPVYLDGYGGFNSTETPYFSKKVAIWLEHGGIYALTNLRGGGEYGEEWHKAGMLEKKQNTFDDYTAAAEYLIKEKYTNPQKLAVYGGSNGGLLIGAVVTQRPDLYGAVICDVPLLDMIRYHKFGIASLWVSEYGSSEDSNQFKYILKYSPYQNVKKGVKYPPILFKASDSDSRVDPLHAKKMAALMQASSGSTNPILLRIESKAGHGQGKPISKVADDLVDELSFIMKTLGMK